MAKPRRHVRCWLCGNRQRRAQSARGIPRRLLEVWEQEPGGSPTEGQYVPAKDGRVGVVGRKRRVLPYGVCGADRGVNGTCQEPMLLRRDARFVLRAVIEWDRRGNNRTSEFDI
jgi:hypothetical protein